VNEVARGKSLTLHDRKVLEERWAAGDGACEIAKDFGVSNALIYRELERGRDGTLDANARLTYRAELGQETFQRALRNRGRRPAAAAAD